MFSAQFDGFLAYLRVQKNASPHTIVSYKYDLEQFENFYRLQYGEEIIEYRQITTAIIRHYLVELQASSFERRSIARKIAVLRSCSRYLYNWGYLEHNPFVGLKTPKLEKVPPKFLAPSEMEVLLAAPDISTTLGVRDRALLETLYATGIRVSELVSLNLEHLELDYGCIRVYGKGSKERIVVIGSVAVQAVHQYLNSARLELLQRKQGKPIEEGLFLNKFGTRLTDRSVRRIVDKYIDKVSLDKAISPHSLRHSCAAHLLDNGADLRSVQELLGHVNLFTIQLYTHSTKEKLRSVYTKAHPRA